MKGDMIMKIQKKPFKKLICVFIAICVLCLPVAASAAKSEKWVFMEDLDEFIASISIPTTEQLILDETILREYTAKEHNLPIENVSVTIYDSDEIPLTAGELLGATSASRDSKYATEWHASYTNCSCPSGVPTFTYYTTKHELRVHYDGCIITYQRDVKACQKCTVIFYMSASHSENPVPHPNLQHEGGGIYNCGICKWRGYR